MAISSPGLGSGLDVNSIVSQLVAAERAPGDKRLARIESTTKAQISAFGALKSALSGLEGVLKRFEGDGAMLARKVTVATDAGYTASAGTSARLGSYGIVVERLATTHKLQSAPVASTTQLGHGRLSISVGADAPIEVDIAAGKGTLRDIRDAINTAAGGKGVTATIVRGDAGEVLALSSTKTGSAGALTITASGGDGGLGVFATTGGTMNETAPAQDARVLIDGVARTSSSNTLTDAIDGITLTLTKADPAKPFTLDVASDASPMKAVLLNFISTYNTALSQLRTQSLAGGEGKAAGALSGDAAPRSMTQALRGLVSANYQDLAALGFKSATDGSLSMDGAKFDAAIAANPEAVNRLLGPEGVLGKQMRESLKGYIGEKGIVTSRSEALNGRIKSLTVERERFDRRIENVEAAYRRQFTALDAMMAKMQSTSSYLGQQLAQMSNQK